MKRFMMLGMVALIAVTAFAVGFTAMTSADSPDKDIGSGKAPAGGWMMNRELGVLNARVADILGVDEEQLSDAFRQAWQEVKDDLGEGINPRDAVIGKVADILGITVEQLTDATEQARQELQAEAQERMRERNEDRLQNDVYNGVITEDEANRIREWWESRPAALDKLRPANRFRHHVQQGPMPKQQGLKGGLQPQTNQ